MHSFTPKELYLHFGVKEFLFARSGGLTSLQGDAIQTG